MKKTYEEAVSYLYETPKFTKKNSLEHTKEVLGRLQIEEERFKIIHVAGSNGKGSVCSAINRILIEGKKKTGMFISPHLVKIEERFCIDGEPCSRKEFMEAYDQVETVVEQMQKEGLSHPTFFEYLFAIGMLIFQKAGVEYLVLETGLGGRLDCTNVFEHPVMTVITSISLEHTEYLGETIEQIAGEKAGIIKDGVPVVYDASSKEAAKVIEYQAKKQGAAVFPIFLNSLKFNEIHGKCIDFYFRCDYDGNTKISMPFVAPYQMMNMALAYQAMRILEPITGIEKETILQAVKKVTWKGRMQEIEKEIYFDGAHNSAGILAFINSVELIAPKKPVLLFSMVADKDYERAIQLLAERVEWEKIFVTQIPDERGMEAGKLAKIFTDFGCEALAETDCKKAYELALKEKEDGQMLFCTGSLYFIGKLLEIAGGKEND